MGLDFQVVTSTKIPAMALVSNNQIDFCNDIQRSVDVLVINKCKLLYGLCVSTAQLYNNCLIASACMCPRGGGGGGGGGGRYSDIFINM